MISVLDAVSFFLMRLAQQSVYLVHTYMYRCFVTFELEISMSFTFELIKNNSVLSLVLRFFRHCKMEKLINSTSVVIVLMAFTRF